MMGGDMGFGGGHGLFGWFWMILIWIIPIMLVIWIVKNWLLGGTSNSSGKTAQDLLDESYARGDIGRDEFIQKRDDLHRD